MKEYLKFYNGLSWIIKLIFAIIPITGWINAFLYRFAKKHYVAGVLCIIFAPVAWIVDLICVILFGKPTLFAQ